MKKNIWIMILAFILAVFIWFEINLTKTHEMSIRIPISVTDNPTGLIPLRIKPETLDLTIEGSGKNIIFYHFAKESYFIDLTDAHYGNFYYPINSELAQLEKLKEYHLKILHKPQVKKILVKMDNMTAKTVSIKPTFANEKSKRIFEEKNLEILPEDIQIKGPKTLLAQIDEITTIPLKPKNFDSNSQIDLIHPTNKLIELGMTSVSVEKKIAKIIQKTFPLLPISTDKGIEIYPNSVTIKVSGEENLLQDITQKDFIAKIDSSSLEIDSLVKVLISLPEGVELIAKTPQNVRIKSLQN